MSDTVKVKAKAQSNFDLFAKSKRELELEYAQQLLEFLQNGGQIQMLPYRGPNK